jgi:hypothetical protein
MYALMLPQTNFYLAPRKRGIYGFSKRIESAIKFKNIVAAQIFQSIHKGKIVKLNEPN